MKTFFALAHPILITTSTAVKPFSWTHLPIFGSDLHHLRTLNRLIWNDISALRLTVANIGQSWANYLLKPVLSLPLSCDYKLYNVHFESFSHISLRFHLSLALDLQLLQLHALTQGAKSSPVDARPGWEASQCQSQILQSQCTMFQGKLLRLGFKKTCDPRFGNLQVSISTHHLSEIHSFYNLLERWTLFGVVWSFLVRLRIMLIILEEGTQSKIQETPHDVEELPQCFWIHPCVKAPWYGERLGQQRLAPGLKCYGLTHDRNEVRFYPQEHNPSPFCSPLLFWAFFDRTPHPHH